MKDWKKVKLGTLISESKVVSKKPDTNKRLRVKLNVLGVEQRPNKNEKIGATKYYIRTAGQFVYGKQNLHKGAFGIVPKELDGFESSLDIPAFDIHETCYPEWIYYYFKKGDFYLKLEALAKGVGSRRIHPKQLYELDIALPSKEVQKRVLSEIESIENYHNELIGQISYQEINLKKLRQSILQDAVQGKLTAKWRRTQLIKGYRVEPASELLQKIKDEKERLIAEKRIKKEKPLPSIKEEEIPFDIPEDWSWCRLGDLILDIEAGKSPKCHPEQAGENKWGVIKMSAISWGAFNPNENKTLPIDSEVFANKEIKEGDFILTRANTSELIAKSVIVPLGVRDKLLLNDKTLRIKFFKHLQVEYLNYYNNGNIARDHYKKVSSGTSDSMQNISRENIKLLMVPLPSFSEQKAIVKEVAQLTQYCEELGQEIKASKTTAQLLMQSVLSELLGEGKL